MKKKILIILGIFLFSVFIRLWNLPAMGRTWDEEFYVTQGYNMMQLIKKGDFTNFYWIKDPDEPVLAKYIYGFAGQWDFKGYDKKNHQPIFDYDLFYSRFASVLFGAISVALLTFFALQYFSPFVAVTSGIVFSTMPSFLGLTQRVTIESVLTFFFTACIYVWIRFLEYPSAKKAYLFGVLLGLSCIVKFSNVLLVPLCLLIYFLWRKYKREKQIQHFTKKILLSFFPGFITFIMIWFMPWLHIDYMIAKEYAFRFAQTSSPWEWFFGFKIHVPWFYYIVHFFIRTPLLLLFLSLFGLHVINKKKTWIYTVVAVWFFFPFIQSFYHFRMHGVRYIIEVYAPFAILVGMGLEFLVTKKIIKWLSFITLTMYLMFIFFKMTPYYLDYFNILAGGAKGVYEKHLFELGWWGQGEKEASQYLIHHAPKHARIGYVLDPVGMMEFNKDLSYEQYNTNKKYDYVVVNYYALLKHDFNEKILTDDYKIIYSVFADGAPLVHVFQQKRKSISK